MFLEAVREDRLEALYVLATHRGLRQGELLVLRWEDVASVGDRVIDALPRSLRLRHEEDGRAQQNITNGTELRV